MKIKKTNRKYVVLVDDNYHYMDESERYTAGTCDSPEDALNKCKEIVIESLENMYKDGISAEKLHAQWLFFGEDPFISGDSDFTKFSAREFITTELCEEIIEKMKN